MPLKLITRDEDQDLARSNYSDMLLDDERNYAFKEAIDRCVHLLVNRAQKYDLSPKTFNVLDAGCGTGLLSLLVCQAFDRLNYKNYQVYAVESVHQVADCARKVFLDNGCSAKVTVIDSSLTSLSATLESEKIHLFVAEVLDAELIGEGCLEIYRHALEVLCHRECLFVPHKANICALPIASDYLFNMFHFNQKMVILEDTLLMWNIEYPDGVLSCPGDKIVHDMQLSALKEGLHFTRVCSEPQIVHTLHFNSRYKNPMTVSRDVSFKAIEAVNERIVVVTWWDLTMYDEDQFFAADYSPPIPDPYNIKIISCAPSWARTAKQLFQDQLLETRFGRPIWRDHWLQCVYNIRNVDYARSLSPSRGTDFSFSFNQDLFNVWFDAPKTMAQGPEACSCGFHRILSRSHIALLNDHSMFLSVVKPQLGTYGRCIQVTKYDHRSSLQCSMDFPSWFISTTLASEEGSVISMNSIDKIAAHDIGISCEVPWSIPLMNIVIPNSPHRPVVRVVLYLTQVIFTNLWRTGTIVADTMGFYTKHLQELIAEARENVNYAVSNIHLYEYESYQFAESFPVFDSLSEKDALKPVDGKIHIKRRVILPTTLNGVPFFKNGWAAVLWAKLHMADGGVISTGILDDSADLVFRASPSYAHDRPGFQFVDLKRHKPISWNPLCYQQVYMLNTYELTPVHIETDNGQRCCAHLDLHVHSDRFQIIRPFDKMTRQEINDALEQQVFTLDEIREEQKRLAAMVNEAYVAPGEKDSVELSEIIGPHPKT